ncbi:hypothetical protein DIURU_002829 [Diutina rugosa]|uniref:Phosphomevalonate kinase n=1 Tax=Diutina rugosa TaxID=5481 RepID=A0A642UNT3_DIURU|nr:uncharacterized protein DIURU_002829 [Diutina rugosa]KAA8902375.1 hypothetical protein DIURU_002829 [Diutina rugosa]
MRAYSAPGKALLAGGYLVIDPQYSAYVTALSACMHSVVTSTKSQDHSKVTVKSPQFEQGLWVYKLIRSDHGWEAHEIQGRTNPFLEATLVTVWNYWGDVDPVAFDITIYSDAGFHAPSELIKQSSNGSQKFYFHDKEINNVPKTGLGSSAGLVVVVSAALLGEFVPDIGKQKDLLHNIAQVAHCSAQGKIGSGFDVAAAVYGSIKFQRFDPKLVESAINKPSEVKSICDRPWKFGHEPISLPPRIKLLMGDVSGGSNTPKLVSQVLQWKKDKSAEALEIYTQLNDANERFMASLTKLQELADADSVAYEKSVTGKTSPLILELSSNIADIRRWIREMTQKSGAAIEPSEQTDLLDACSGLSGCIGGVVPGAGGYDAICVLVLENKIDEFKAEFSSKSQYSNINWLDLEERSTGIQMEIPNNYHFT